MLASMVSPIETAAIIAVPTLIGTPIHPIAPMTSRMGKMFGTSDTRPIRRLWYARIMITRTMATVNPKLTTWSRSRLSIRNVKRT